MARWSSIDRRDAREECFGPTFTVSHSSFQPGATSLNVSAIFACSFWSLRSARRSVNSELTSESLLAYQSPVFLSTPDANSPNRTSRAINTATPIPPIAFTTTQRLRCTMASMKTSPSSTQIDPITPTADPSARMRSKRILRSHSTGGASKEPKSIRELLSKRDRRMTLESNVRIAIIFVVLLGLFSMIAFRAIFGIR